MLRKLLNRAVKKRSRPSAPSVNAEPEAPRIASQVIAQDEPDTSPPLQDIASGGRGAQRLAERVSLRHLGTQDAARMSGNDLLSLPQHQIQSRISRRFARIHGNSSRINTLGGPARLLTTGGDAPAGVDPTWLNSRQPVTNPEETTRNNLSAREVNPATSSPRLRETDQARSVQPSLRVENAPSIGPTTGKVQPANLPAPAPAAPTLAVRSIARLADLGRITTAPIRRVNETLKKPLAKPLAMLRRKPLKASEPSTSPNQAVQVESASQAARSTERQAFVSSGEAVSRLQSPPSAEAPPSSPPETSIPGQRELILQTTSPTHATPETKTTAQPIVNRQSEQNRIKDLSPPTRSLQQQPVENTPTKSHISETSPNIEAPHSIKTQLFSPLTSLMHAPRMLTLRIVGRSRLAPETETIAERVMGRSAEPRFDRKTSLSPAAWSAPTVSAPTLRPSSPEKTATGPAQQSIGTEKRNAAQLPLAAPGPNIAVDNPGAPLVGESRGELRPALQRRVDEPLAVRSVNESPTDNWQPQVAAPIPALPSRPSENGTRSVVQRKQGLVSRAKDLILRSKPETGPMEPRSNSRQLSQLPAKPARSDSDRRVRVPVASLAPQHSAPPMAKDAATLVYRTVEQGEQVAGSTTAPPEKKDEIRTAAGQTFRPGQSEGLGTDHHNSILDISGPPTLGAPQQALPVAKESSVISRPQRQPAMISRFMTNEMNHNGKSGRPAINENQNGSLNLLGSNPEKITKPLPLALGSNRHSQVAAVAAALPGQLSPVAMLGSNQSPGSGMVSRQLAPVPPDSPPIIRREAVGPADVRPGGAPESAKAPEKTFDASEIEFLASKVYSYIKQKLIIEKERHGRPGVSWWT